MQKKLIVLATLLLFTFALSACGESEKVVAIVNDVEIYESDVDASVDLMAVQYQQYGLDFESEQGQTMLPAIRNQALENLIQQEVLLQAAKNAGFSVSDETIDAEIENTKAHFSTDEDYEEALENAGLTHESYRIQLVIGEFFESEIVVKEVSEEEIQALYDEALEHYEAEKEAAEQGNENGDDNTDEDGDDNGFPDLEELRDEIEEHLIQEDRQAQISELVGRLMSESDIERLVDYEAKDEE